MIDGNHPVAMASFSSVVDRSPVFLERSPAGIRVHSADPGDTLGDVPHHGDRHRKRPGHTPHPRRQTSRGSLGIPARVRLCRALSRDIRRWFSEVSVAGLIDLRPFPAAERSSRAHFFDVLKRNQLEQALG